MEIGTALGSEWLADLGGIRSAAIAYDEAGLDFLSWGGHVLTSPDGAYQRPSSTYAAVFRDFFIHTAALSVLTQRIRFRSGIVILPMFPTVLVAKQAAELSLLSGGRFDLGVGISWNEAEYIAMGQRVSVRGRRLDEQLVVLHELWTEPFVTFHGEFHDIDDLGIGERPEVPVPVWIGCGDGDVSLARVARHATGWMPIGPPDRERIAKLRADAIEHGRPAPGVVGRISADPSDPESTVAAAIALVEVGVSSLSISAPAGSDVTTGVQSVLDAHSALREALA